MFGPIPGENLVTDKTNKPWHSPPEFTDINAALDKIVEKITGKVVANQLLSLCEVGLPLYRIAALVVMEGVSAGKWTMDMALLLVGPTTKILEIMAESFDVEYNLGIEDEEINIPTGLFVKEQHQALKNREKAGVYRIVQKELPQIKEEAQVQEQPEGEEKTEEPAPTQDIQSQGFAKMMKAPEEGM